VVGTHNFTLEPLNPRLLDALEPYTYLRGIDGRLPSDKEPEKEQKTAAERDPRIFNPPGGLRIRLKV
jgi:hypothetical protein